MTQEEMHLEIHRLRARIRHLTASLEDFEHHGLRSDLKPVTMVPWGYDDWVKHIENLDMFVRQRAASFLGPIRKESSGTMKAVKP
jgi:hypothetical protein